MKITGKLHQDRVQQTIKKRNPQDMTAHFQKFGIDLYVFPPLSIRGTAVILKTLYLIDMVMLRF